MMTEVVRDVDGHHGFINLDRSDVNPNLAFVSADGEVLADIDELIYALLRLKKGSKSNDVDRESKHRFTMPCEYSEDDDWISVVYNTASHEVFVTARDGEQMAVVALPMRSFILNLFSIMPHCAQDALVSELMEQRGLV